MKQIRKFFCFALLLALLVSACTPAPTHPTREAAPLIPTALLIQSTQPVFTSLPATSTLTATSQPNLPVSGEIYLTLKNRDKQNPAKLSLVHVPAGCLRCSAPVIVPGFDNSIQSPQPLTWSPDSRFAAYTSTTSKDQKPSVILYNPADNSFKTLAQIQTLAPDVYWSLDGQWLAFQGQEQAKMDLYVVRPDGSHLTNITKSRLAGITIVSLAGWLKDQLVFTGGSPAGYFAYALSLNNLQPRKLSNVQVFRGYTMGQPPLRISPDNHWIAYTEINSEVGSILAVLSLREGVASHPIETFKDGVIEGYTWSPNGDWLAFWVAINGQTQVYLVHPDSSVFHSVYSATTVRRVIFNPHGEDFLLVETADDPSRLDYVPLGTMGLPTTMQAAGVEGASWEGASWRP